MNENINNNTNNVTVSQWYKCAVSTALVGAVFSFIVLVLIFANFIRSIYCRRKTGAGIGEFKSGNLKTPDDEQLLEKIRQRDLRYRQNIIRTMDFNRKGSYLLLGSVVIMLPVLGLQVHQIRNCHRRNQVVTI